MRVVLAKQRKKAQPAEKRSPDRKFDLNAFNPLRPILRWMRSKSVGQPSWNAFVSWQTYYSAYLGTAASHALIHHGGPYVGGPDHQIELLDGMNAGRGPTIVYAPPGCGKSRFALELAQRIEQESGRWQVVFVRHDEAVVRQELHELMQLKRVVFIVDDAHEYPALVKLLADACAQTSATGSPYLVCLTRSTRRAQVSRALNSAFPTVSIREIDLGRPSPQLVRTLIDQLLPQSSPLHRETIARFVRQSYFGAVLVCGMLRREAKLPQSFQRNDLRDRICHEALRDAADSVCPMETALRALAVYAAVAPVPKASAEVRDWAARLTGLTPPAVETLIDRALKADLLQEYGQALLRPTPDLRGDLILEEACLDAQGKATPFSTQLLEELLDAEPLAAAANCAEIGQLFATAEEVDLLSKLVLERARTTVENQGDVLELLRAAEPLAERWPAIAVELAGVLEERGILRRNPSAARLSRKDGIEMRTCALLMSAGEADPTGVPVALGLGRDLYAASREDARSREHVLEQLNSYCRFEIGRSLAHAHAVANALHAWSSESDAETAVLSASLSAQFLPLEVQRRHLEGDTANSLRSPLSPVPEVWAVRDVVIDTLARGMAHGSATVQCFAIGSLERYNDQEGAADRAWSDRWLPQLTREVERLSAALLRLATETASLPVLAAAELQGWQWWAQEQDFLYRGGLAFLQSIPETDAYRLWKLLHGLQLPLRTTLPEPTPQQPQDRREQVQAFSSVRDEDRVEQARQLFDTLDGRCTDSGAWRALWLLVLEQSPRMPLHRRADVVVGEFARRHPEAAWSFVNAADAEGSLFALLPFLLAELGKQDRERRSREALNVPRGTRLEEAWLRALSFTSDFNEPERALLARGLESPDPDTVYRTADALLTPAGDDRSTAFRRIFDVIARRPTDSPLWELAIQHFVNWAEPVLPPLTSAPTAEMAVAAEELLALLRSHASHLRWGFQRHTRQLVKALAIIAVLSPRRMQEWMRRDWSQPTAAGAKWNDESPLTVARLREIMRLIADSPAAAQWAETFLAWMSHEPRLGSVGALGLAELCSLDDTRVSALARAIGAHPTDAALQAFTEFLVHRKNDRAFPDQAITLLEVWTAFPESYAYVENAVVHAFVDGTSSRLPGRLSLAQERALKAIDSRRGQNTTSAMLLASLERAEREIHEATAEEGAQDESDAKEQPAQE